MDQKCNECVNNEIISTVDIVGSYITTPNTLYFDSNGTKTFIPGTVIKYYKCSNGHTFIGDLFSS